MNSSVRSAPALVVVFCAAEVATMAGFALIPSLLPQLTLEWALTATQGGWLGGIFFLGYIAAVPALVSLTDRHDARTIHLASAAISALALIGLASTANGFVAALVWWWLAGLGLGGTYMPGVKAMTDRLPVAGQSRATAFYTATFGIGAGLSYLWIELARQFVPWRSLFWIAAAGAMLAVLLVSCTVAPRKPAPPTAGTAGRWPLVLRDRRILAYCGGYFGHNWELFGFRAWLVAYLTFTHARAPDAWTAAPGVIAAMATFLAVPASILGNEGAHRWGRRRWLTTVMPLSATLALAVAIAGRQPAYVLVPLLLVYAASMNLDSAALTAGVLTETPPEIRGAALALYSSIGFTGAMVGPVAFGVVLDAFGRGEQAGWSAGFLTLAAGVACGRWAIGRLARSPG